MASFEKCNCNNIKIKSCRSIQCTCHKALNYLHNKSFYGTNLHFKNGFRHHDLKYFSYVLHKIYPIFPAYNDANCTGIRYANYQFEFNGKWQKNWQNHCWLHNRVTNTMISLLDFCWKSFSKWWRSKWVVQKKLKHFGVNLHVGRLSLILVFCLSNDIE